MTLRNQIELQNTRQKLSEIERRYKALRDRPPERLRDLSMHSLKRLINQLKEEIAIFEAHSHVQG